MKGALVTLVCAMLMAAVVNAGSSYTNTIKDNGITFVAGQNVTVDSGDHRFDYRAIVFVDAVFFVFYASLDVQGQGNGQGQGTVTADAIVGAAAVPSLLNPHPPAAYLLYFHEQANVDVSQHTVAISGTASGSGVAIVYARLDEMSADGTMVITPLDLSAVAWSGVTVGGTNGLHTATWTATSGNTALTFAVVGSSTTGILNIGGAPITPKNTETVLEVSQSSYASTGNFLRLTAYTASASADASFAATAATLISGSGPSQIYLHFANDATIDGNNAAVKVTGITTASSYSINQIGHQTIATALSGNSTLHIDVRKITVDFPAGAKMITYDPAQGFDAPKVYSGASTVTASVVGVAFAVALALLL